MCQSLCAFFKPGQKEDMACGGFTLLTEVVPDPAALARALEAATPEAFGDRHHHLLHHALCRRCPFYIDGCDFTDPQVTNDSPPCGGYMAIDMLLDQDSPDSAPVRDALMSPNLYLSLGARCRIKHLEKPYLYHLDNDDMYELDAGGLRFLKQCDGTRSLAELEPDPEFLEFCLEEGLLELSEAPAQHDIGPVQPSPVPSLRYLELQLTRRCNIKCKHCYLGEAQNVELPFERALSLLREFDEMQGLRVLITGGEPMLYKHFKELNERLPEFGIRKVLLTNGMYLQEENYEIWSNFDEIQISVDGLERGHEAMRGAGTWERTLRGVHAVKAMGMPLSLATMVHPENIDEFEEMAAWVESLDLMEWNIDQPTQAGRFPDHPELWMKAEQAGSYLRYGRGGGYHSSGSDDAYGCGAHLSTVGPSGNILKCGYFPDSPYGRFHDSLHAAWDRAKPVILSELDCAACPHLMECHGGCRFRADGPKGVDPVMCKRFGVDPTSFSI
ncbi:MAG: radical SAM protein [Alphaproteobacteria bacterium]|nr:radical SAM protein [Alphaproteobacteria bacterium]